MKSSRVSLLAFAMVFLVFYGILMSCAEATASIRLGVFAVNFMDEEVLSTGKVMSMSTWKKYKKLQDRYYELFMNALSQTGKFEAVDLKFSDKDYQAIAGAQFSNKSDNKPYFSRSMTDKMTQENIQVAAAEAMKNARVKKARQGNCRYVVEASVVFDNSSKKGADATATLLVEDMEKGEKMVFSGMGTASSSSSKRASSRRVKKVEKSTSEPQDAKEQVAVEAFNQALIYMHDEITGDIAKVIDIKAGNIILNKGSVSKVRVGDVYFVQAETSDGMEDVFGASSESSRVNLAIIRVQDVQEDSSTAAIVEGGGNIGVIRAGDRLKPVGGSRTSIDDMLSEVAAGQHPPFPTYRPEVKQVEVKTPVAAAALEPLPALPPGTIRVGVMNFENKADGISDAEASTLTDLFSRMLSNSDKIAVLERDRLEAIAREQKLNLAGVLDPATAAKVGKLAGCEYILLGSVTGLQENEFIEGRYIDPEANRRRLDAISRVGGRAGQILAGLELLNMMVNAGKENVVTETHEVITEVDARLVKVETSQITAAFSEQGSAAQSDVITQDMEGHVKNVEANYGSLQSQAIASAAANLSHKIRENLTGEQVQISSVNGDEIIVNRGSASGVQTGDLFCVYSAGQSDGDTEAIISVTDVQEAFSTAEIAKSITASYSPAPGYRLDSVSHGDFQRGIWHIKNQRRAQATERNKQNISLEELANRSGRRNRLEISSTDAKRVIKGYGLNAKQEKSLIDAHSKAATASSAKKKYESYKQLSEANMNDYLAAYNAGRYALELSKYAEAREWASKALFVNPRYKPAMELIAKIDKG